MDEKAENARAVEIAGEQGCGDVMRRGDVQA
jgi:hypothetical protein